MHRDGAGGKGTGAGERMRGDEDRGLKSGLSD